MWYHLKNANDIKVTFKPEAMGDLEVFKYSRLIFAKSETLHCLTLDFAGCGITDNCMIPLFRDALSQMRKLRFLQLILDSTSISNNSLQCLGDEILPFLVDLETLYVEPYSVKTITNEGVLNLFNSCKQLKDLMLHLQDTNLTDEFLRKFATDVIPTLARLTHLELILIDLLLSDASLIELLTNIQNIETIRLYLSGTEVTDLSIGFLN